MKYLVNYGIQVFESNEFAQATICDLSKATEFIDHAMLLHMLAYYGLIGKVYI